MNNLARQVDRKQSYQQQEQYQTQSKSLLKKKPITLGERLLYFITILGLFFATYLIISTAASIYVANNEIHTLEKEIRVQTQTNEALQLQVTELSAPDRILNIAREELGMTLNDKNVKVVQN